MARSRRRCTGIHGGELLFVVEHTDGSTDDREVVAGSDHAAGNDASLLQWRDPTRSLSVARVSDGTAAVPEVYSCHDCGIRSPIQYQGDVLTPNLKKALSAFRWRVALSGESIMAIVCHQCFAIRYRRSRAAMNHHPLS